MRAVVYIKQVFDPRGVTVNRRAGKVFFNREDYLISPADRNALEAALRLKDADDSVEVVALAAGPERCEDALREALGMGADKAVRLIVAPAAAPIDGALLAQVLLAALPRLGKVDLLLTGERALDLGIGEVAPRVAHALGQPVLAGALEVRLAGGAVEAVVRDGEAYVTLRAPRPAVISVARDANRPRYPHAPRLARAYREMDVECWDEGELELDEAAVQPRLVAGDPEAPPELDKGRVVDDLAEVAAALRPFVASRAAKVR